MRLRLALDDRRLEPKLRGAATRYPHLPALFLTFGTGVGILIGASLGAGFALPFDGKPAEVPGSETVIPADLVLLAMGFVSPLQSMLDEFGVQKDNRGNAKALTEGQGAYVTSVPNVFAAGDVRRGQSLVVWAIREGRQCARSVDEFLMGFSELPR